MADIDKYTKKEIIEELVRLKGKMVLRFSKAYLASKRDVYHLNKHIKSSTVGRYVLRTMDENDEVIILCKIYFPELYSCMRGFYWTKSRFLDSRMYPFRALRPTLTTPSEIKPVMYHKETATWGIPMEARLKGFENNWK